MTTNSNANNQNPVTLDDILLTCTDFEKAALGGLVAVQMGLGRIDAALAKTPDGEEVLAIVVKYQGKVLPIGHICKDDGGKYYTPVNPQAKAVAA